MVLEFKKSFLEYIRIGVYVETELFHQLVRIKVKNIIEANPHDEGTTVESFMKSKTFFGTTYQKKNPSYIFLKKNCSTRPQKGPRESRKTRTKNASLPSQRNGQGRTARRSARRTDRRYTAPQRNEERLGKNDARAKIRGGRKEIF